MRNTTLHSISVSINSLKKIYKFYKYFYIQLQAHTAITGHASSLLHHTEADSHPL